MDQDPKTAGGTDTDNLATSEPGQDTQTFTNETVISRPVDSHHIEHDLRLPGDQAKRRKQIIIGATIGVLVLVLGGLATWFFAFYNNPEKAMFDGVSNLFRASNVSFDGGGSITLREGSADDSIKSIILNLNSSSSKLPNSTDASLLISFADDKSLNLQLGTVQLADGVIYLKVGGIMDSLQRMGLDAEAEGEMEDFFNALETIDGEWWRISIRDVLADMTGSEEISGLYGGIYDCAVSAGSRDNSRELVDLYKQHKFLKVEPVERIDNGNNYIDYHAAAWHNLYEISFDKDLLAGFINALPETAMAEEMYACYNSVLEQYDSSADPLSAADIDEISADDIDIPDALHLYAEVSQFGHKIRSLWAYGDDDTWDNVFSVLLQYQEATVAAPSEYRDITELFEILPIEDMWGSVSLPGTDEPCYCPDSLDVDCDCSTAGYDDDEYYSFGGDNLPIDNEIEGI